LRGRRGTARTREDSVIKYLSTIKCLPTLKHPRLLASAAAAAAIALSGAGAAHAAATVPVQTPPDQCSAAYFDGDAQLGPDRLPMLGRVGLQLIGYRRTGEESPQRFLHEYRNASGWIYPPNNGYVGLPDGQPVEWVQTLHPGQQIDRYGSVYGSFLAPEGTAYAQRSIPPSSLDSNPAASCNYHDYQVRKPFRVDAGPIAAWFAQPGGGEQFQLDPALLHGAPAQLNVLWLLDNGYLAEVPRG
jgi:hypothetical protein